MWELAQAILASERLLTLFERNEGRAFFDVVRNDPATKDFAALYDRFAADFGHRGHEDRDVYFKRRIEDPACDYAALRAIMTVDAGSPDATAQKLVARREALTEQVAAKIRQDPWGELKAEAFLMLQRWMLKFFMMRDDQREFSDRVNFTQKRFFMEIGRRLADRGALPEADDHFFFAPHELLEIMEGWTPSRLIAAKLKARKRNFQEFRKDGLPPMYFVGDTPTELDVEEAGGDGTRLRGISTSRGLSTGTARIITSHKDMGRLQKGDILVTTATDPGWTPVFMVISGIILETGGLLAHGSCLSREYGIPAVQIGGATSKIRDGATITLNGNTGDVVIHDLGSLRTGMVALETKPGDLLAQTR